MTSEQVARDGWHRGLYDAVTVADSLTLLTATGRLGSFSARPEVEIGRTLANFATTSVEVVSADRHLAC